MPKTADKLAYALSSSDSSTRQQYKRLFDRIYLADAAALGFQLDDVEHLRRETARNLEALGLCDFLYGEEDAIRPCEPHMAILPRAGLPAAILCGARTPSMIARVKAVARSRRSTVLLTTTPQPEFPLLPSRVLLQAPALGILRDFATAASLRIIEVPVPGLLLGYAAGIDQYLSERDWKVRREEPTWRRDDFDVATLRFRGAGSATTGMRLSQYTHPRLAHRREHVLVRGDNAAIADRDWAKYAVLASVGRNVLRYDPLLSILFVPMATPLPRIYARAMTACSGFAPQRIEHREAGRGRVFVRVPAEYAHMLAMKLAQEFAPISFPDPIRGAHD